MTMLEQKLARLIKYSLYAVPFIALLYIQGFFFPFIITKTIFFRALVIIASAMYLFLLWLDYARYRPRVNTAFVLVAGFFVINLAAAIFGLDFYKSFWSNFERMEGLSGLIFLVLYLFFLINFLPDARDWRIYLRLTALVGLLGALYGLFQRFNLLSVFEAGASRTAGTLGNAAFFAGFLLLSLGLTLYYYLSEDDKKYRVAALLAAVIELFVLMLTQTRGALLGLAVGLIAYLILNTVFSAGRLRKYSAVVLAILMIAAAAAYIERGRLAKSDIELVRRLATISLADPTVKNRLLVWQMAIGSFKEHPILGVGMENFDAVYNKYYTPAISEDWFDRTHNIYLDQLSAAGVLGLASYLSILGWLFYLLFKKRKIEYQAFAILTSLLVAYAIHNFFVFDVLTTAIFYFLLIGLISFRQLVELPGTAKPAGRRSATDLVMIGIIILAALSIYKLVYLPLQINRNLYVGYRFVLADTAQSREAFAKALEYKFGSAESAYQLSQMYALVAGNQTISEEEKAKYYALTAEKLKFAHVNYPLDVRLNLHLGQLLINNFKTKEELEEAKNLLEQAVVLSPTRPEGTYLLFNLYLKEEQEGVKGSADKAIKVMEDLIARLPWFGEPKLMLASAILKKDPAKAKKYFDEGIKQEYRHNKGVLTQIISYLINTKRYKETIGYYFELIDSESERLDYRMDLAQIYFLDKQMDKAIEQVNLVNEKNPSLLKKYADFLNALTDAYNKAK
jgi:O-antigen ligase